MSRKRRVLKSYAPDLQLLPDDVDEMLVGVTAATVERTACALYDWRVLQTAHAEEAVSGPFVVMRPVSYEDKESVVDYWKANEDSGMVHIEGMNAAVIGMTASHPFGEAVCGVYAYDTLLTLLSDEMMEASPVFTDMRKAGTKRAKLVETGTATKATAVLKHRLLDVPGGESWPFILDLKL